MSIAASPYWSHMAWHTSIELFASQKKGFSLSGRALHLLVILIGELKHDDLGKVQFWVLLLSSCFHFLLKALPSFVACGLPSHCGPFFKKVFSRNWLKFVSHIHVSHPCLIFLNLMFVYNPIDNLVKLIRISCLTSSLFLPILLTCLLISSSCWAAWWFFVFGQLIHLLFQCLTLKTLLLANFLIQLDLLMQS